MNPRATRRDGRIKGTVVNETKKDLPLNL